LPEAVRRRLSPEATALALHAPARAGTPAQLLRRRAAARVVITGRSRLGAPVAVALAQSGVGHVFGDLAGQVTVAETAGGPLVPADAERPRSVAVAEAVRRAAPDTEVGPVRRGHAAIVVVLGHDRPAALLAAAYAQRRQAHLALAVRDGVAVVGPLVTPAGGPCLNCLDLHRRDRDPQWPQVAAQLAPGAGEHAEPCTVPTLLSAAAYAAAEVLAYLDRGCTGLVGGALEITSPGSTRRRTWPPHPRCPCRPGRGTAPTSRDEEKRHSGGKHPRPVRS
ncbi:MAG TPA: hypothetical protein VF755_10035, partial [Catenuloplanes sp.]